MGSGHGLYKLQAGANKIAALDDYRRACAVARERNRDDVIKPLPARAGHKTIDKLSRQIVVALGDESLYAQFPDLFYAELSL